MENKKNEKSPDPVLEAMRQFAEKMSTKKKIKLVKSLEKMKKIIEDGKK